MYRDKYLKYKNKYLELERFSKYRHVVTFGDEGRFGQLIDFVERIPKDKFVDRAFADKLSESDFETLVYYYLLTFNLPSIIGETERRKTKIKASDEWMMTVERLNDVEARIDGIMATIPDKSLIIVPGDTPAKMVQLLRMTQEERLIEKGVLFVQFPLSRRAIYEFPEKRGPFEGDFFEFLDGYGDLSRYEKVVFMDYISIGETFRFISDLMRRYFKDRYDRTVDVESVPLERDEHNELTESRCVVRYDEYRPVTRPFPSATFFSHQIHRCNIDILYNYFCYVSEQRVRDMIRRVVSTYPLSGDFFERYDSVFVIDIKYYDVVVNRVVHRREVAPDSVKAWKINNEKLECCHYTKLHDLSLWWSLKGEWMDHHYVRLNPNVIVWMSYLLFFDDPDHDRIGFVSPLELDLLELMNETEE